MSWAATAGRMPIGAQHGRIQFMRPKRASSVNMIRSCRLRRAAARRAFLTASGKPFFKSILRCKVTFGMKWTRHQFAPAVPVQQVIDRAVAGYVTNCFLVRRLEIVDIQHLPRARRVGKTREQGVFFGQCRQPTITGRTRLAPDSIQSLASCEDCTFRRTHSSRRRREKMRTLRAPERQNLVFATHRPILLRCTHSFRSTVCAKVWSSA